MQGPLNDRKTNTGFIISSHAFTNPKNMVKIGPVYSEITCLEFEPLKNTEKKQQQNTLPAHCKSTTI